MIQLLASAVRAATNNTGDLITGGQGVEVVIDITAVPGADTVTVTIQNKDSVSGKYSAVLVSAALVAAATTRLRVYPGIAVAANLTANDVLSDVWRVLLTHSAATNFTYSLSCRPLL